MRDPVDLPRDGDRLQLRGRRYQKARGHETAEVGVAEGGAGCGRGQVLGWHILVNNEKTAARIRRLRKPVRASRLQGSKGPEISSDRTVPRRPRGYGGRRHLAAERLLLRRDRRRDLEDDGLRRRLANPRRRAVENRVRRLHRRDRLPSPPP